MLRNIPPRVTPPPDVPYLQNVLANVLTLRHRHRVKRSVEHRLVVAQVSNRHGNQNSLGGPRAISMIRGLDVEPGGRQSRSRSQVQGLQNADDVLTYRIIRKI